jgi:predicted GNAT family N-acyltransferase
MHVRRAYSPDEIAACLQVRRRVFIDEQRVPEHEELDDLDSVARHFLAAPEKGSPPQAAFGTARLVFLDDGTAKVQRVAVLRAERKRGVGAALMFAVEGEAARARVSTVILGSQLHALKFYERLGYQSYGDVFLDAGIEHRMMKKEVL